MAITSNDPANFTPTRGNYKELTPFRFWCQKVLPLVYDDSLSYYELLNKVVNYLNITMEDVTTLEGDVTNLHTAYEQLQTYVNDYFVSLDVQEEIDNKLDEMAIDGSLTEIVSPFIPDIVEEWLNDHITPTTPLIDNTLSVPGAGADSKTVGDIIGEIYSSQKAYSYGDYAIHNGELYKCTYNMENGEEWTLSHWAKTNITDEDKYLIKSFEEFQAGKLPFLLIKDQYIIPRTGEISRYVGWNRSDFIPVEKYDSFTVKSSVESNFNCFYDENKNGIPDSYFNVETTEKTITVPSNAKYVIFSNTAEGMDNLTGVVYTKTDKKLDTLYTDTANEFNDLNKTLVTIENVNSNENLINKSDFPVASEDIMNTGGYINNNNGEIVIYNGWIYSDFVEVETDTSYRVIQPISAVSSTPLQSVGEVYFAFYDEEYKYTHGGSLAENMTASENDKYLRFSIPAGAYRNYDSLMLMTAEDAEVYTSKTFADIERVDKSIKYQNENTFKYDDDVIRIDKMYYHKYRYVNQIVDNDDYCYFDVVFNKTGVYGVYNSDGEITCTYISSETYGNGNYVHRENIKFSANGISRDELGVVFHVAILMSEYKKGLYICNPRYKDDKISERSNSTNFYYNDIDGDVLEKEIVDVINPIVFVETTGYVYIHFDAIKYKYNGNLYEYILKDTIPDLGRLYNVATGYEDMIWLDIDSAHHPNNVSYPKVAVLNVIDHKIELVNEPSKNHIPVYGYYNDMKKPYGCVYDYFVRNNLVSTNKIYNGLTIDMIQKINTKENNLYSILNENDFCFAYLGDDHNISWMESDYIMFPDRVDYTNYAIDMCDKHINFDAIFNLGDSVLTTERPQDSLKVGLEIIDTNKLIYVEGNHDRNIRPEKGITPKKEFFNLMYYRFRNNPNYVFGDTGKASYYYVNFPEKKIRFVCLDLYEMPSNHDSEYDAHAGYRQNQFEWLVDSALKIDSDWSVIVGTHSAPTTVTYGTNSVNMNELRTLLEAFKNGTNVTITATDSVYGDGTFDLNVEADFSAQGARTLICVMSGHCHWDNIEIVNGISYVTIASAYLDSSMYKPWGNNWNDGTGRTERFINDYSSICFDICILDKTNRKLKLKRIGYGSDREINY